MRQLLSRFCRFQVIFREFWLLLVKYAAKHFAFSGKIAQKDFAFSGNINPKHFAFSGNFGIFRGEEPFPVHQEKAQEGENGHHL